jgi:hypothetical protein
MTWDTTRFTASRVTNLRWRPRKAESPHPLENGGDEHPAVARHATRTLVRIFALGRGGPWKEASRRGSLGAGGPSSAQVRGGDSRQGGPLRDGEKARTSATSSGTARTSPSGLRVCDSRLTNTVTGLRLTKRTDALGFPRRASRGASHGNLRRTRMLRRQHEGGAGRQRPRSREPLSVQS